MVRFGHDGWQGQIARDVTFDSIESVARAAAFLMVRDYPHDARLVVGFDRRFLSEQFARQIARDLASLGIAIWLIPRPIPTPVLSFAIKHVDAVGGIMVTGGNSPADESGLKLRGWDGGGLPRWMLDQIEEATNSSASVFRVGPTARVTSLGPVDDYLEAVSTQAQIRAIRQSGITVAIDSMWGAGSELIPKLVDGDGSRSIEIRTTHNPAFPEFTSPSPVPDNLVRLRRIVRTGDAALGIALSADGCQLGLIDENGVPVTPGELLSIIAWYLLYVRRQSGAVARTITASSGVDWLASDAGTIRQEIPHGYTRACEVLRENPPMLFGDDEGGIVLLNHLLERDALMTALLVISCVVQTRMELSEIVDEVRSICGTSIMNRSRIDLTAEQADLVRNRMVRGEWPATIAGLQVERSYVSDGAKLELESGAWLLIRQDEIDASLQFVAESDSADQSSRLIQAGRQLMLG